MSDVVVAGSSNLDLVVTVVRHPLPGETLLGTDYHEYPGGKGLNQVVAAARAGAATAFVSALGEDAAGDRLAAVLIEVGIDDAAVQRIAGTATGRALITVDASGENSIVVIPAAGDAFCGAFAVVASTCRDRRLDRRVVTPAQSIRRSWSRKRAARST